MNGRFVPIHQQSLALVREFLEKQPEFAPANTRWFESHGDGAWAFGPFLASARLLIVAYRRTPQAAIRWLDKMLSIEAIDILVFTEVFGMLPPEGGLRIGDFSLIRFSEVPPFPKTSRRLSIYDSPNGDITSAPHSFLLKKIRNIPIGVADTSVDFSLQHQLPPLGNAQRILDALSASGLAFGSIGRTWSEFLDEDVQQLTDGLGWTGSTVEALPRYFLEVTPEDAVFARAIMSMTGRVANKLEIACARLNLARRRPSTGDQAIEGSICLETLLGDHERFDLTYKIALRAALLIENDFERRLDIRSCVREFYSIRSETVHRGKKPTPEDAVIIKRGLEICQRIVHRIVEMGRIPDWPKFEMSDGHAIN